MLTFGGGEPDATRGKFFDLGNRNVDFSESLEPLLEGQQTCDDEVEN